LKPWLLFYKQTVWHMFMVRPLLRRMA